MVSPQCIASPEGKKCDRWGTRRFRHIPRGMTGSSSLKVKETYIGKGTMSLMKSDTLETTTPPLVLGWESSKKGVRGAINACVPPLGSRTRCGPAPPSVTEEPQLTVTKPRDPKWGADMQCIARRGCFSMFLVANQPDLIKTGY